MSKGMVRNLKVGILGYRGEPKDEFEVMSGTFQGEPMRGVFVSLYVHGDPYQGGCIQVSAADARRMARALEDAAGKAVGLLG